MPDERKNPDTPDLKRELCLFAVLLLIASLCCPAAAQDVKVALTELRPTLFTDEQGRPAGFFVDIIEDIAAQEGWNVIWVRGSLSESWGRLSSGEIDLLAGVAATPERESLYDFSREPALSVWSQVYARPGSGINTILDLDGKKVGTVKGALSGIAFQGYAKNFGVNVTMIEWETPAEVFAATAAGEADALVVYNTAGQADAVKYGLAATPVMFNPTQFGFAVQKGKNADLLPVLDRYVAEGKANPSSAFSRSMQKWFGIKAGSEVPVYIWWGLGIAACIAVLFLVMSAVLRCQVRKKTAELSLQNEELQTEITRRRQAESDLIAKNEELRAAYEQLSATGQELKAKYLELGRSERALMQARSKLSLLNTFTIQDIQTGIFTLMGYIQLARDKQGPEAIQASLHKSEEILRSLSESLDFAKKYQNLGIQPPRWQNVNYVALAAVSHLDLSRIHHTFAVSDLEIYADPLFEEVFVTLMENVIQRGVSATKVSITYRKTPDNVILVIEDDGVGIPAGEKERIFSQEYPQKARRNSLFLAREILAITGITIVENGEPGKGARFELTVPQGGCRLAQVPDKKVPANGEPKGT